MNSNIYEQYAPLYHSLGLPAIPLFPREKRPSINDWNHYADQPLDKETAASWVKQNPNGNIGMALGATSGLIMIDIDTEDDALIQAILSVLPPSPWIRKGRKGMMMAYKYSPIKTHRIKNISGETIVECLSSRTQCVLPPSIHPDTKQPYTANCELVSVLDQLNFLPLNVEEILRNKLTEMKVNLSHSGWSRVTDYVSAGSRDTTLTEMAGLFAYAVVRGERSLKEAIGLLRAYHSEYIDNASGDVIEVDKHIQNLIKFLHRDVYDKGRVLPRGWDEGFTAEELENMGVTLSQDETEWSFEEIQKYLQEQFEAHAEGKARAEAVERVLAKIARSNQLTRLDEDRALKYIVDVSGLGVPVSTFRARLRELRTGDVLGQDHSEIARAVLKDLEQINLMRYHGEKFMKWAGSHWVEEDKGQIKAKISANYGHMDACRKANDINGILNVLSFLMEQGIQRKDVRGINFANGFLTQELKLIPHDPDLGMTYTLPFRYIPEEAGRFPLFDEFLSRAWGRDDDYQEKRNALQEAMCVTLFGMGSRFQRAILLHGAPQSGKTQLLRIVESMLPAEAKCAVPPEDWGDKFLPAQMHGRILNVIGELSERKLIDGQKFKDIVDGSEMSAQHKNQQVFKFKPTVTHWFASNHMPRTSDTSAGFIRRWLFLTFNYPVKATEKKTEVGNMIAAEEREQIVAWAAQAMPRLLQQQEYTQPHSHRELSNEAGNINNSVRYFIKESGKVKLQVENGFVSEMKLINSYTGFCLGAGGVKPVSSTRFRAMMRELSNEFGFKMKISQGRMGSEALYEGITLVL